MLNKATNLLNKQMKERDAVAEKARAVIADAQEALRVLGFEQVSLDKVIDTKPIIINKGQLVVKVTNEEEISKLKDKILELEDALYEKQNVIDIQQEELEYYHGKEEEYDSDVQGMEEEIAALNRKIKALEMFNNAEDIELEEPETMEGGDAVETVSEQPKINIKKFDLSNVSLDDFLTQATKEQEVKIAKEKEEKEAAKAKFPEYTLEYHTITYDEKIDSRTKFGVEGTIKMNDKEYFIKATNNHADPIAYGCMDTATIQMIKEIMINDIDKFNFNTKDESPVNYDHINDADYGLAVWRRADDKGNVAYHAYTKDSYLVWEPAKYKMPMRKLLKNLHSDNPNHCKPLGAKRGAKLADKFMAVCANIWPEDFTNDDHDPEPTKDKVFKITKEQHQPSKDKEQVKVTKEQHQSTNDKSNNSQPIKFEGFDPLNTNDNFRNTVDDGDLFDDIEL